jgi:hypothetical protein
MLSLWIVPRAVGYDLSLWIIPAFVLWNRYPQLRTRVVLVFVAIHLVSLANARVTLDMHERLGWVIAPIVPTLALCFGALIAGLRDVAPTAIDSRSTR